MIARGISKIFMRVAFFVLLRVVRVLRGFRFVEDLNDTPDNTNRHEHVTLLHNFQRLLSWPRQDRAITDLDDRPLEQRRILDDRFDYFTRRRLRGKAKFLRLWFALSKDLKW